MKNKLLANISYGLCAVLGFLNFILFAFPYAASYYSYDLGEWGGKQSNSAGISGYEVMKLWDGGFGGVMSALIQIALLILGIAMLAYGIYGLAKAMNFISADIIPENLVSKTYAKYALYAYAALNVLLLVFLIILCVTNSESESELGFTAKGGIRLSAGIFITLVFGVGSVIAEKILPAKLGAADENAPTVTYNCKKCGKKVRKTVKFCPDCGGEVEERVALVKQYECSVCHAPSKAGVKFCTQCGGEITEKV